MVYEALKMHNFNPVNWYQNIMGYEASKTQIFQLYTNQIWDERHYEDKLNVCYENLTPRELLDGFLLTQDGLYCLNVCY